MGQGPWAQGPLAHGLMGSGPGANMGSLQWVTLTNIGIQKK